MPERDWRRVTLFEADCFCCVVRVEGFRDNESDHPAWMAIEILSPSEERWRRKLSSRLRRCWSGLRAEQDEMLMIHDPETAAFLLDALSTARSFVWGDRDEIR